MRRITMVVVAAIVGSFAPGARGSAQSAKPTNAHLIVIQLIDKGAGYAFQPASITAQRGDTLRFVQASSAPHNVDFKKVPKGAKVGVGEPGPYLMDKGQTYELVLDDRFTDGSYQFICDPHESAGMNGTLIVGPPTK